MRFDVLRPLAELEYADAPLLRPLGMTANNLPSEWQPVNVWKKWFDAPKQPLLVQAQVTGSVGVCHFDDVLSVAALRWWHCALTWRDEACVMPLPLQLIGTVAIAHKNPKRASKGPRLPVWATTPLDQPKSGHVQALCIGNEQIITELLQYIHLLNDTPCTTWTVQPLPYSEAETLDIICEQRNMPGSGQSITPPHWFRGWHI